MSPLWVSSEFFRPLVNTWLGRCEAAYQSEARRRFVDEAEEAKTFYGRSCAALWESNYARHWLRGGLQKPRFPISVNKTFEAIAVLVPHLLAGIPYRNVTPKRHPDWSVETIEPLFAEPELAQALPYLLHADQLDAARAKVAASLMEMWLNYSARELPYGGLEQHSRLSIIDAMLTGRGVMFVRTHRFPGSHRTLTGCFREDPLDVVIDPDVRRVEDAKWVVLRHQTEHWKLEQQFQLPADSLRHAATLESAWDYGERAASESTSQLKGQPGDIVVWYECWSRMGVGCRFEGAMDGGLRRRLHQVAGDHAYIAFTSSVPWPLNCPPDRVRAGMTDEQVRQAFSWPIATWADQRWPFEFLDWYPDPDSVYPIAPLSAGMGHLKFINVMFPFLCERTHSATRNFWAVAAHDVAEYRKYLESGAHNTVIPIAGAAVDDVRKAITILEQPTVNTDAWRVIDMAVHWFELATGLTAFMYGAKGTEPNDRSARETEARARSAGIRMQFMQEAIAAWEGRLAATEAFCARWFIRGDDLIPLLGHTGRHLWERYIQTAEVERVVRELDYTVAVSSISRPDLARDLGNWSQVLPVLWPSLLQYGMNSGDFAPANTVVVEWAKAMQLEDPERLAIRPPEPDPEAEQAQAAVEQQNAAMEMQSKQLELQAKELDLAAKRELAQIQTESKVAAALLAQEKSRIALETAARKAEIDLTRDTQSLQMEGARKELDLVDRLTRMGGAA